MERIQDRGQHSSVHETRTTNVLLSNANSFPISFQRRSGQATQGSRAGAFSMPSTRRRLGPLNSLRDRYWIVLHERPVHRPRACEPFQVRAPLPLPRRARPTSIGSLLSRAHLLRLLFASRNGTRLGPAHLEVLPPPPSPPRLCRRRYRPRKRAKERRHERRRPCLRLRFQSCRRWGSG